MDRMFFKRIETAMKNMGPWDYLIICATILPVVLIYYSLTLGVSSLVSDLLYIPIIITAYTYPRRGTLFAIGLGIVYLFVVFLLRFSYPMDLIAALARFYIFVFVGIFVSYLALRLMREEQIYHRIFELPYAGITLMDPKSRKILQSNHHMEDLFGYTADELKSLTISDLIAEKDKSLISSVLKRIKELPDTPLSLELTIQKKTNETLPAVLSLSEIHDETEMPDYLVVLVQEMTERKLSQHLRYQQAASLQASIDGVIILDPSFTVTYVNDAFARMFSCKNPSHLVGKSWSAIYQASQQTKLIQEIIPAITKDGQWRGEMTGKRHDGTFISLEISASAIEDGGTVCIVRDITERKLAEQALYEVNKKLNLVSNITRHDIHNQIFTLLGCLHIIRGKVNDPAIQHYLQIEEETIQTISHRIDFTKNYQDMGLRPPSWQDVQTVFLYAISHLDLKGLERSLKVDELSIYADPLLEKVFQTLVENTLKHGGKATRYSFVFEHVHGGICLVYEDDGIGITTKDKESIFEHTPDMMGGLNLFLSRETLSITGIGIRETGEPGKGARFEIFVPHGAYREAAKLPVEGSLPGVTK